MYVYDRINTIYQFIKTFLDKKKCLFEVYGAFKRIVNMYLLLVTGKLHQIYTQLAIN